MTKADVVARMAANTDFTKAAAERFINATLDVIETALVEEGKISLSHFGVFAVEERKERHGRNPRTGEPIVIAASKVVKFRPGKTLKDATQ